MIIDEIDLSVHNCAISKVLLVLMYFLFNVIYLKGNNNTGTRIEHWETCDVALPLVECGPLVETAWNLLLRK